MIKKLQDFIPSIIIFLVLLIGQLYVPSSVYDKIWTPLIVALNQCGVRSYWCITSVLIVILLIVISRVKANKINNARLRYGGPIILFFFLDSFDWPLGKTEYYPYDRCINYVHVFLLFWLVATFPFCQWFKRAFSVKNTKRSKLSQEAKSLSESDTEKTIVQSDSAITNEGNDRLGRAKFARILCDDFIRKGKNQAFSVGVEAGWGDGKTSFLNLIKEDIKKRELAHVIEFSPYDTTETKTLITQFFVDIENVLKPYNANISRSIRKYARVLSGVSIAGTSFDLTRFAKEASFKDYKGDISNAIGDLDKPLVVLIDELDRVGEDEILAVLQMIAQTANFKNTVFFSAYSSVYVKSMLKDKDDSGMFLEKFFNVNYSLPQPNKELLIEEFEDIIYTTLSGRISEQLLQRDHIKHFLKDYDAALNIRTVKRLANSVYSSTHLLYGVGVGVNLCLYDLLNVQLLEMVDSKFLSKLFEDPSLFLMKISRPYLNGYSYSMPTSMPKTGLEENSRFATLNSLIAGKVTISLDTNQYIEIKLKSFCSVKSEEKYRVVFNLLSNLFKGERSFETPSTQRIWLRRNMLVYAERCLGANQITSQEFKALLDSGSDIRKTVEEWSEQKKLSSVEQQFYSHSITVQNAKRFIDIFLSLINCRENVWLDHPTLPTQYVSSSNLEPIKYTQGIVHEVEEYLRQNGELLNKIKLLSIMVNIKGKASGDNPYYYLDNVIELLKDTLLFYWEKSTEATFNDINYPIVIMQLIEFWDTDIEKKFVDYVSTNLKGWYEYIVEKGTSEHHGKYRLRPDLYNNDIFATKGIFVSLSSFEKFNGLLNEKDLLSVDFNKLHAKAIKPNSINGSDENIGWVDCEFEVLFK